MTLQDRLRALGVLMQTQIPAVIAAGNPDQIIKIMALFPEWGERHFAAGDVVIYNSIPYKCVQEHDAQPDWAPDKTPALWASWHARSAETALPFVQPTGAHDQYLESEYMVLGGIIYRCIKPTAYPPADQSDAWEAINAPADELEYGEDMPEAVEPGEDEPAEILEWEQRQGAHDQYQPGDKVTFEGGIYECVQATTYSPGQYPAAWEVIDG
ncbi:hypothetical protein LJC42_00350 [Eubacteriales bacterium OttesenSCG-928-K08]|nr:hypothetical protein [Eubacteriales bacterium OttesenSCG-928-K08]